MNTQIKVTAGFPFKKKVNSSDAFIVFLNALGKNVIDDVVTEDDNLYLEADSTITSGWIPGKYVYQVQDSSGIIEQGNLFVLKNLALLTVNNYLSMWEKALQQVDEAIIAKSYQTGVTIAVGDKHITYSSLTDLLKLKDYILARIDEEKAEEGEETFNKNNEHRAKFVFRI